MRQSPAWKCNGVYGVTKEDCHPLSFWQYSQVDKKVPLHYKGAFDSLPCDTERIKTG